MPNSPWHGVGANWSANRRIALVALVLTALLVVAGCVAWFTGRSDHTPHPAPAAPSASTSSKPSPTASGPAPREAGSVPRPPQIADPIAYAKAVAAMLWSYDTRNTSRDQQIAGMRAWMTAESTYADWASILGQVPDPVLWSRMADQDQHASAAIGEGHYPTLFKQALAEDPSAITEAYVYVVTVHGKQKLAWKGGGGAEDRAVTVAVQCRPDRDCALAAIAPRVAQ
ncbi:hypothetical protein [Streptomyces buecherae]|uniref:hypothetical protein n=1 Tax=Streptomyces buecherae TaxID=2763006 RepID=UPI0036AF1459